jgi:urease accessory protein
VDPARPAPDGLIPPARVGRDGRLRLVFAHRGGRTVLTRTGWTLPLQVLAPLALDDPAAVVSVLNPTGGLVGGDRLIIDVAAGPGTHACLTTPSATRVYRSSGAPAVQDVTLRVGVGATLEWVPDHTIPFAGSSFRQSILVEMAEGARLILVDAFSAGRVARGEAWRFALLDSALRIRDARGWLLVDRFVLAGGAGWSGLGGTEGAPYFATVAVIGDVGVGVLTEAAGLAGPGVAVGTLARGGLLVRCLARDAVELTDTLDAVWRAARRAMLGLDPPVLRKG